VSWFIVLSLLVAAAVVPAAVPFVVAGALAAVAPVHEQMDGRAGEQQEPGQSAHEVGPVLGPQEVDGDERKSPRA
jgi:hypothetical protein